MNARWSSGTFVVIHPSGSRCGAAVRVRLQLKFKQTSSRANISPHCTNQISPLISKLEVLERPSAPRAPSPQLPPLPVVNASTLTLESLRHVQLPPEFEFESVYLSLTTILDGKILHNTAPMLCSGKIEWEDVISLHSRAPECDTITVLLSAQNENNSQAAVLGSTDIDLSMLQLMKCISGWYSILDSSGNCVAYVKLRIDSKSPAAAATPRLQDEVGASAMEGSASDSQVTENMKIPSAASPTLFAKLPDHSTALQQLEELDYSAPALDDLRSKMKELDSVSAHLKRMLQRDDMNGDENENSLIESLSAASVLSLSNAENSAPHALIAYAGDSHIFRSESQLTSLIR
jgi:hypothetical protein